MPSNYSPQRRRWLQSIGLLSAGAALGVKRWQDDPWPIDLAKFIPESIEFPELPELSDLEIIGEPIELPTSGRPGNPKPTKEPVEARPRRPESYPAGTYGDYLSTQSFRYIKPHEVIRPHRRVRQGVNNTLPPRRLWANITPTLKVADEIRHRLGKPLTLITSAYRCPAYNRVCGGASRSWHMQNKALDLIYDCSPEAAYAIAKDLRREGFFKGGVGLYRGFIHVDTRGYNATWQG
ncbi:MAG: D-Ala-D-Ala carboxypeptidase family metallohydrolase [Verrucomicrobiota bacterium JB023]|nr:D-Ala-D-Ala carboxypeptidase family metallohydrolase [Verrucomicrobiota bacterium JB023]